MAGAAAVSLTLTEHYRDCLWPLVTPVRFATVEMQVAPVAPVAVKLSGAAQRCSALYSIDNNTLRTPLHSTRLARLGLARLGSTTPPRTAAHVALFEFG